MKDLTVDLNNLKVKYRNIFLETAIEIQNLVEDLRPAGVEGEIFDILTGTGKDWQEKVYSVLREKLIELYNKKTAGIKALREQSKCSGCGACCKFAVSEFSPDELAQKSQNGDNYAKQFLSVFIPYENLTEAGKVFPEYLALLGAEAERGYYFYHCPKVTSDNICPDYENRPQICRDFPDNPAGFLPLSCGYNTWKLQSEDICLKLNAEVEIIEFYLDKLKVLLNL